MPDVTFTVDGKKLTAPAGTLLIEACRKSGIEMIEPEAFEGIRIGLDFALSTSRAAVEIAGGFSRS